MQRRLLATSAVSMLAALPATAAATTTLASEVKRTGL
jgi:hypothetical protein